MPPDLSYWRFDQLLNFARIDVFGRNNHNTCVDSLLHWFAEKVINHGLNAEISHFVRILNDEALHLPIPKCSQKISVCIKADERDITSLLDILQGEKHAGCRGFVW